MDLQSSFNNLSNEHGAGAFHHDDGPTEPTSNLKYSFRDATGVSPYSNKPSAPQLPGNKF